MQQVRDIYNEGIRDQELFQEQHDASLEEPTEQVAIELVEGLANAVDAMLQHRTTATLTMQGAALKDCALSLAQTIPSWKKLRLAAGGKRSELDAERQTHQITQFELREAQEEIARLQAALRESNHANERLQQELQELRKRSDDLPFPTAPEKRPRAQPDPPPSVQIGEDSVPLPMLTPLRAIVSPLPATPRLDPALLEDEEEVKPNRCAVCYRDTPQLPRSRCHACKVWYNRLMKSDPGPPSRCEAYHPPGQLLTCTSCRRRRYDQHMAKFPTPRQHP